MHELVFVILVVLSFLVGFVFNEVIRGKKSDDGKMEFSERLKNGN